MPKANNKKICIVVSSLGKGGAERSSGLLSQMLYNVGYDVHIVSVLNNIEFPYKGKLLNLGELKAKNDSVLGRLNRLKVFKRYLKEHNFDYVIDSRTHNGLIKEFIISKFIYTPSKTIYCVRNYKTKLYIHPNKYFGRILYKNAYKIIGVSNAIVEKLIDEYRFKNVQAIHNPVDFDSNNKSFEIDNNSNKKFILFFGRLDDEHKNISLLLEAYSISELPHNNIDLKILGDGKDLEKLKNLATALEIGANVQFLSYNPNPSGIVKSALFTLLTSRYEGFPRSIIESLSLGTPVISVDCESGPNEIIENNYNGILIENHNPKALAEAMNRLFGDKDLYRHCKNNAKTSVTKFSVTNIVQHWQSILK